MELLCTALLLLSAWPSSLQAGGQYQAVMREHEGSGLAETSGDFPSEFLPEDFEYHEVNDIPEGRSEILDLSEVIGPEYLISRRIGKDEPDQQETCDCHCYEELAYEHEQNVDTKHIDFFLQDKSRAQLCSPQQQESCCRDYRSQARFRFPDSEPSEPSEPLLPEIPVSESVLLGSDQAPSQPSSAPQTTQSTSAASHWDVFTVVQQGDGKQELEETIPSMSHWFVLLELDGPATVSLKLSSRTAVALLVKKSKRPRLKDFDILDVMDGTRMEVKMFSLTGGSWHLRLSNEEPFSVEMLLTVLVSGISEPLEAFSPLCCGPECPLVYGEPSCPGQCQHGLLAPGKGCHCHPGWVGAQCNISQADCSSQLCNDHGECVQGEGVSCQCREGYQGTRCETAQCPQDCADNGLCLNGTCKCFSGWEGVSCNITATTNIEVICPDSLLSEEAVKEECAAGWTGEDCSTKLCDPRCSLHGACVDGECVCQPGWSGTHCTLDDCPGACSGHGQCGQQGERWGCHCQPSWTGPDCSIQLETSCSDGVDNDDDSLTDCEDPECCYSDACSRSQYCSTVPPPAAVLANLPQHKPFDTFFDRHKFLIQNGSLQKFAKLNQFDKRRVSVVRGRVLTPSGQGLRGVRVSNGFNLREGFTLTRADGFFDILVTAGKIINLKFGKSPFPYQTKNIFVPSNQIVVMEDVYLKLSKERSGRAVDVSSYCEEHNSLTRPALTVTDSLSQQSNLHTESLSLEPFKANLVHSGGRQRGYTAVINIVLLRDLPASLMNIHTKIIVEGRQFDMLYEAEAGLNVTFKWDGYNVYGMKHYGKSFVTVHVGYKYKLCHQIQWQTVKTSVHAHIPLSTDLGGWNLDLHHVYNTRDGIVYKGDGENIDLQNREKLVKAINENLSQTLITPLSVVSDDEGIIYVGDSQFIRKIYPHGKVINLLQLNESTATHKYYLALSHGKGKALFMSDPVNRRILRIPLTLSESATPEDNFQVVVGNGELCTNTGDDSCGDGEYSEDARLVYPKGMAVTVDNELIFVDGNTIRMLDLDNRVVTIAGLRKAATDWRPSKCGTDVRATEANFNWPTELAINPLTQEISLVDQGAILSISREGRVREMFSNNCPGLVPLLANPPSKIAFSQAGELWLADDKNILHVVDHSQGVLEVAGSLSVCKRSAKGCRQSDFDEVLTVASKARFSSIGSIDVGVDGTIYIADSGKHLLRTITAAVPVLSEETGQYQVLSVDTEEVFMFDREGRHLATSGLFTGQATGYDFIYSGETLLEVRDKSRNEVKIARVHGKPTNILLSNGMKFHLKTNKAGQLEQVIAPTGLLHIYKYDKRSFITRKMIDRKLQYSLTYDDNGHLQNVKGLDISILDGPVVKKDCMFFRGQNELIEELYGESSKINPMIIGYDQTVGMSDHRIQWDYFIHSARTRSSFSANVDGIGKRLQVNGNLALTSELHPRSRIRSLYDENGLQLLKVEMYAVPKRTILIPRNSFSHVDQTYDDLGRPKSWTWGDMVENLQYDKFSRIINVSDCVRSQTYSYQYEESLFPSRRTDHSVQLDNSGGLEHIETPSGHRHQFSLVPQMGSLKLEYLPPWSGGQKVTFSFAGDGTVKSLQVPAGPELQYFRLGDKVSAACPGLFVLEEKFQAGIKGLNQVNDWTVEENRFINETSLYSRQTVTSTQQGNSLQSEKICHYDKYKSSLDCLISVNGKNVSVKTTFSKISNEVTKVGDFQLIRSLQSHAWVNNRRNIVLKTELGSSGQVTKREVSVSNEIVWTTALEYDCAGRLVRISQTGGEMSGTETTEISYTQQGRVGEVEVNGAQSYSHHYDQDGNLLTLQHSRGELTFSYQAGERVQQVEGREAEVGYTDSGALATRDGYVFSYNCLHQLESVSFGGRRRKELVYDVSGRPVLIMDLLTGTNTSLSYSLQDDRQWEVAAWHRSDDGHLHSVTYDNDGAVLAVENTEDSQILLVVTDQTNTPRILLDQKGSVVKKMEYSPFGFLVDDTNDDVKIPIGYYGGVDIEETGIVLIKGRPYDSLLGQWMTPDFEVVINLPSSSDVTDIHLYRFNKNDPVNINKKNYMNKLDDWLKFLGYDLDKIGKSILQSTLGERLKIPRLAPKTVHEPDILNPNIQRPLSLASETRNVALARSFHLSSPVFPNVIISLEEDLILTHVIEGASPVEAMMAELVNSTIVLRNYGDPEVIYFVRGQGIDDRLVEGLKSYVNIQERRIAPHGREVCFSTASVQLCGLSGPESVEEKYRQTYSTVNPQILRTN